AVAIIFASSFVNQSVETEAQLASRLGVLYFSLSPHVTDGDHLHRCRHGPAEYSVLRARAGGAVQGAVR
ncbi:unnamed protein product, partial [Phaeothamnion confervicola]